MSKFDGISSADLAIESNAIQRELAKRQIHDQAVAGRKHVGKAYVASGKIAALEYTFVIGLTETGSLDAIRFYREADGDVCVRRMTTYPHLLGKPITRKKWNAEAIGIVTDIRGMLGIGGFAHEQTSPPRKAKTKKTRGKSGRQQE